MSTTTSVRFGRDVTRGVDAYMAQSGWNRTVLVNTAVAEWLKVQDHPGIRFVPTPTGARVAALVNGPEIWTVAESWNQHSPEHRAVDNLVAATGLSPREVSAALAYYADYREEIDAEIARVYQAQTQARQAWERRQALHGATETLA